MALTAPPPTAAASPWRAGRRCRMTRRSRLQALGVAREHGGLADVVQPAEQHDDALQAHAAAAVRRRAVPAGGGARAGRGGAGRVAGVGTTRQRVRARGPPAPCAVLPCALQSAWIVPLA